MVIPARLRRYLRAPASREEVEGFQLDSRPLPEAARRFYGLSDGLAIPEWDTEVLSLAAAKGYGEAISRLVVADYFGLLPITDSNDSNPYCLILGERLQGAVIYLSHEGEVCITHSSLTSFLEAVADALDEEAEFIDELEPEELSDPRLVAEADAIMLDLLQQQPLDWEAIVLTLIPACSPQVLIRLLSAEDMWVRERAAERCGQLELLEARDGLQQLANAGKGQDARAAKASLSRINRKLYAKGE